MATISGTAVSLSSNYYLGTFYQANRDASSATKRKDLSNSSLSQADATALHRAAKKLRGFNYSDDTTDGANIYSSVSAFVETYNNAMSSSSSSSDSTMTRYGKYLHNLSRDYEDELEDIGITLNSDGTLSANDNLLKAADISDVKKIFGNDSDYAIKTSRYARRMTATAKELIFTEQSQMALKEQSAKSSEAVTQAASYMAGVVNEVDLDTLLNTGIGANVNISI